MKRILSFAALTAALCTAALSGLTAATASTRGASFHSAPTVCCKSGTMCPRCPACCSKSPCPTGCCVHCTAR